MSTHQPTFTDKLKATLKNYGPAFFIIGYVVGTGSVMEWISVKTSISFLNGPIISTFFIALLIGLFWTGKHENFIKIMSLLVGFMALAFIITSIMVLKESGKAIADFFPSIPTGHNTGLIIAGMVGTTMAGVCLASRSILVQEQNWKVSDLRRDEKDAMSSMLMTFLISLAIMISATGTLYFTGVEVDSATDLMHALGPWAGEFALTLFTLGIIAAGLSPIWILIASQALSPFVMPLITLFLIILLNKSEIMKAHKIGLGLNIALGATFMFNCYMLYIAIVGFIDFLS